MTALAQTRYGIVAAGETCHAAGCGASTSIAWVSVDGRTWTPIPSPGHIWRITDGPAGVLSIGSHEDETAAGFVVWRLHQ